MSLLRNGTRDLPASSLVPQSTTPQRALYKYVPEELICRLELFIPSACRTFWFSSSYKCVFHHFTWDISLNSFGNLITFSSDPKSSQ
jgi:hypothetical protein